MTGRLLYPGEAARRLNVTTDTLRRWAKAGVLTAETTTGGHRRYLESEIEKMPTRAAAKASTTADPDGAS